MSTDRHSSEKDVELPHIHADREESLRSALEEEYPFEEVVKDLAQAPTGSLHPNSAFRRYWDLLILSLVGYTVLTWGLLLGFAQHAVSSLYPFDMIVNIAFVVDMWLYSRTCFLDIRGTLVSDPVRIRNRYLHSTRFKLDIISVIPFELLGWIFDDYALAIVLLRFNYFFRVVRVTSNARFDASTPIVRILKLLTAWLVFAHLYASVFAWIGSLDNDGTRETWLTFYNLENTPSGEKYIISLYYSVVSLSAVGYGDIRPVSPLERLVAVPVLIISMLLYASTVGLLSAAIDSFTTSSKLRSQRLERVKEFASVYELPRDLRVKLRDYASADFQLHKGFDMEAIFSIVPPNVRREIMSYLYGAIVCKMEFFRQCSQEFVTEITGKLNTSICLDGDAVFNEGDSSVEMYFVHRGEISIIRAMQDAPAVELTRINALSKKPFFGEVSLMTGSPRGATAKAVGNCFLWYLKQSDFLSVIRSFPEEEKMFRSAAIHRLENDAARVKRGSTFPHIDTSSPAMNSSLLSPSSTTEKGMFKLKRTESFSGSNAARLQENLRKLRNGEETLYRSNSGGSGLPSPSHKKVSSDSLPHLGNFSLGAILGDPMDD